MAKIFEVGDELPLKIRIFFDTESDYYHLYKPIIFPDLEPILGVKCGANLFPVAIFNPDVFPPEDDFESDNYVFFSDGHSLIKIYDLTTNTWLTSSITCDLSGFTEAERTVDYVTNSFPVADFLNGITYESREYYNIYFNNVYEGEMPTLELVDVSKIPDTLPVPVRAGYTFVAWYIDSALTTRAVAGATIEEDTTLYAKWHTPGSLFTEIADAIRSKDGTSESIRDVDFGERVKQIQPAKEEETKTVTPDFSSGNQVITPTSGKVLSQVTLTKPTDLLPENIAKDKNVCGVVGTSFIAVELTQTQYDALSTKASNTYYLIVEE